MNQKGQTRLEKLGSDPSFFSKIREFSDIITIIA
jgi:hypothetical protein